MQTTKGGLGLLQSLYLQENAKLRQQRTADGVLPATEIKLYLGRSGFGMVWPMLVWPRLVWPVLVCKAGFGATRDTIFLNPSYSLSCSSLLLSVLRNVSRQTASSKPHPIACSSTSPSSLL